MGCCRVSGCAFICVVCVCDVFQKWGWSQKKADKKEVDDNVVKTWKPLFMRKNVFGFITGRVFSDCMMNDVEA